ncbi:MAG: sodium:solute symporter family protein [Balneolaceae bacterium]|nr:sodium:solute symporter family protein [Balneolaceae bacterium]
MDIALLDWLVIFLYAAVVLAIGYWFRRQAGRDMSSFFLGGRNMPWYLAGLSMVATTFAADTPLAVTELIHNSGISGNWLWWNFLVGGMLTTLFFSRLWRRAGILTEIEFIEIRYSGKPAAFLRGLKTVYLGLLMNTLFIGWVNIALISILTVLFDIPADRVLWFVAAAMAIAAVYSTLSGLIGVVLTDVIQFVLAMIGSVALAIIVISSDQVGGIEGLRAGLPGGTLRFFPDLAASGSTGDLAGTLTVSAGTLLAYVGIQWWASMYPGAEPGGGGFVAQRMMSTRTEKESLWATLLFQVMHYTVRPWPWILVGLSALLLYPELTRENARLGYVMAINDFAPVGLKGLLIVSLLAAYMSTISTFLNLGASYLVNDFYKRFLKRPASFASEEQSEQHYVLVSRISTILIMLLSLYATTLFESISEVWMVVLEGTAGLGLVMILRWYWWRVNVWSEITATVVPLVVYTLVKFVWVIAFPNSFFITVGTTTAAWLLVTFLTRPTDSERLRSFCRNIRPGLGWGPVYRQLEVEPKRMNWKYSVLSLLSTVTMVYAVLFLVGKFLFGFWSEGATWLLVCIISFAALRYSLGKRSL